MAEEAPRKKTHKEWRKEVKKLRRKRIRQKLAEERNKKAAEEEADPEYQAWLHEQEELESAQREQEERQRQEQEELWMRRELIAKKIFREQQRKHEATAAAKEAERLRIQKEFEELQQQAQKRRDERRQREEQAEKEHEQMLQRIAEYIEFGGSIPEELTSNVQSNPNKQLCPFFAKTNACRYGMHCCRNHIRPKLSKILFFPNFFSNITLEQAADTEEGSDINLEYTENERQNYYVEFFEDVLGELKKYGEIVNFRTCMNGQPHLRGNVLVEYSTERESLKAYMELQGRYYASRQINVEFSSIVTWKSAICGLSYTNKCPKGRDCNFLHIFKNPGNMYNISVFKQEESVKNTRQRATRDNSVMSWNDDDNRSSKRNWRWSESPEPSPSSNRNGDKKSKESNRSSERKPRYDDRYSQSKSSREGSSSYSSRHSHRSGHSSRRGEEKRRSKPKTPESSRKRHEEDHRKRHHKDKKRKHKSKRSHS